MFGDDRPSLPLDPFQIYCIEKRKEVATAHQHLSSSKINSILANQWRELDEKERENYANISISLESRTRSKRRQKAVQLGVMLSKNGTRSAPTEMASNEVEGVPRISASEGNSFNGQIHGLNGKHFGESLEQNGKLLIPVADGVIGDD